MAANTRHPHTHRTQLIERACARYTQRVFEANTKHYTLTRASLTAIEDREIRTHVPVCTPRELKTLAIISGRDAAAAAAVYALSEHAFNTHFRVARARRYGACMCVFDFHRKSIAYSSIRGTGFDIWYPNIILCVCARARIPI